MSAWGKPFSADNRSQRWALRGFPQDRTYTLKSVERVNLSTLCLFFDSRSCVALGLRYPLHLIIKVQDAEAELGLAVAQLQVAREQNPASQDMSVQQVLLMLQLRDVETRLDAVGVVRSSYDGTVKKLKWLNQVNRELTVEITLTVHALDKAL